MAPHLEDPLRGWHFLLFNLSLGLGHFLVLFNAGAYLAMFPHVAGSLGVNPSHVTWTQTDYFIGMALAFPVTRWMAHRFGEVRLFVAAFVVLAAASLVCALTHDLYAFLSARIIQGFFGGVTIPLSQTVLLRQYPPEKRSVAISLWSIATLSPLTLGPAAGGWIADTWGWRWLFYVNIPLALLAGLVTGTLLLGRESERIREPLDKVGFVLLALVAGCVQTVLNQGQDDDWYGSTRLMAIALLGVAAALYFLIWEWDTPAPLVDLRLFLGRNFSIGMVSLFFGFLTFQGLLSLYLLKLQFEMGYPSLLAGLVLLPMAIFAKPVASFFHRVTHYFDARWLASLNFLGFAAACYWVSSYDRGASLEDLFWPQALAGVFLGGFFVPLTVIFLSGLDTERQTRAVELSSFLRVAGGSFGITLVAALWSRRTILHRKFLVEGITPFNASLGDISARLQSFGLSNAGAKLKLDRLAAHHAAMLSFNEMFWLASWAFLGLGILVLFASPALSSGRDELRERALEDLVEEP